MFARLTYASALAMTAWASLAVADEPFVFKDGDRVVFVGDTLIEREGRYGYLETALTIQNPGKHLTFRNLGWSGDTVRGLSRAGFDPPEVGFERLIEEIRAAEPTVLVCGYGMADSFDGESGLASFIEGYESLLDRVAFTKARLIFLTPIAHEDHGPPLPNPARHNAALEQYARAVETLARKRGAVVVNLLGLTRPTNEAGWLTDNGIHLTESGSRALGERVAQALAGRPPSGQEAITLGADGRWSGTPAVVINQKEAKLGYAFRLRFPGSRPQSLRISAAGLGAGRYSLVIDTRPAASGTAADWGRGVVVPSPEIGATQRLRIAINRKNELFFHRWRPQNITYLFGFRKHEQGNNAIEVPRFDPLVREAELKITELAAPAWHTVELSPIEEGAGR